MELKEARRLGIEYCESNNCSYTYISHDSANGFYLTEEETKHTVFFVKRNGALKSCRGTNYAIDFHKELKKRKNKRSNGKREIAKMLDKESFEE